ncbi:hypothetical protein AGOR_G00183630 [Albula goreensis]|uniref:Ig-like domain-containing protein n=1 Tax=Albula goreensis TaxID=1534307 RepID=A0A8T3CSZ1_9TELE|nr:hypothetical protein AGOR_G00183630 [Albula goreensis]
MPRLSVLLGCLILSFLTSCGDNQALNVIQTPPSITVKEGDSVHMHCCWGKDSTAERLRVIWRKRTSETEIINIRYIKSGPQENKTNNKYSGSVSGNCSELNISSVSTNDTGLYICEVTVEIPQYNKTNGTGSHLTVEKTNNSFVGPAPVTGWLIPFTVVMGVLCLCAVLCYWRKRRMMPYPGQASGRVGMVIHEVPHEEGEEVEEVGEMARAAGDNGSNSSHESTQWCAVPVYESFDYFAVQTSEDG